MAKLLVASVVDFERFWGWCTRWQLGDGGVRFPPGPSSDVHLGRLEWRVNDGEIEKLREWKDKINRTDWSSRARCEGRKSVAWAGLLGWGSFRWLLGSKGARRVKVADGCWCLGVGGGRCVAGGACGWNGCCRPGKVGLLVRNEVRAEDLRKNWTIWGNYASRSGTVGAVGARLDRDWMAIGIALNLSNSFFPPLPPTPPLPFRAPLRPKTSLKELVIPLPQTRSSPFPYNYNASFPRSFFLHIFSFSPKTPTGAPKGLTMPAPQPPKRCLNQPPTAIPAMLSTLLSPFQLVPGFRPLLSGLL